MRPMENSWQNGFLFKRHSASAKRCSEIRFLLSALNGSGKAGNLLKNQAYYEELIFLTHQLRTLIADNKEKIRKNRCRLAFVN